ncbi:FAD-binding oxidoreductase [Streptomyces sp. NPDC048251]|uniref:FAD-binding oxidoreductase n=1 Tax=Streptomyces sp. NPDC048251 TaxID=3154501 RepID=UPI0034299B49
MNAENNAEFAGGTALVVEALKQVIGPDAVITDPQQLADFLDPYTYQGWDATTPIAAVLPATVEEVQAIVRLANEHGVPLWTVSQGRNNGYGGQSARVDGSVIVNLSRMNRVLEVNDEQAYAVVEPGVRFLDLRDHLRDGGHKLWPSSPDLGWGSVIGNTLEYGRGYTPYGDHASTACGMEVVLANGDILRTGMGAMADSKSWHAYPWSYGPTHTGLFMQSNFGIVTKMGVWLMPEPEAYHSCWATFEDGVPIENLIDVVRGLMLEGTIRNYPMLSRGISTAWPRTPATPDGWWLRFALYGPEATVDAQYERVRTALEATGDITVGHEIFHGDEHLDTTVIDDKVQGGISGLEVLDLWKGLYGDSGGHIDVSPVLPFTGPEVVESIRFMRSLHELHGVDYHAGLLMLPRSVLHVCMLGFDSTDEDQTRKAFDASRHMVVELAKAGYPIYRTHIQHMDLVADQFDFNDHAQRRFNELLKDALDPAGILSPGKQGIWPKAGRPEKPRDGSADALR